MKIETVTVYASSSDRVAPVFKEAGFALGAAIARKGWLQVNGGGSTGLMRAATDGGLSAGGVVKAVILKIFLEKDYLHEELNDVVVENSMPGRKRGLYELGDAYIALPGGLGTYEEIMEVLSWRQLGFHERPIALLNVAGFYDGIAGMLDDGIARGFIAANFDSAYKISSDIDEILAWLEAYRPAQFSIDSKV